MSNLLTNERKKKRKKNIPKSLGKSSLKRKDSKDSIIQDKLNEELLSDCNFSESEEEN